MEDSGQFAQTKIAFPILPIAHSSSGPWVGVLSFYYLPRARCERKGPGNRNNGQSDNTAADSNRTARIGGKHSLCGREAVCFPLERVLGL